MQPPLGNRGRPNLAIAAIWLRAALIASAFAWILAFAAGKDAGATEADDLLREEMGVDYEELTAEIYAAFEAARRDALRAGEFLLTKDGNGYDPDAADAAMALYEVAVQRIRETLSKFETVYEKVPLLFVQLDYLIVKSMSGMAAVLSIRGDADAAYETRQTLIGMAEETRERIAFALARNVLPQFHEQYRQIDDSFRLVLLESHVWMGHEAETFGRLGEARTHYQVALDLTAETEGQEAIQALLDRVDEAENAAMVPATAKPGPADALLVDESMGDEADEAPAGPLVIPGPTEARSLATGADPTSSAPATEPERSQGRNQRPDDR